ncbi:MAG: helix-turn-helix domain-containing protein [Chitinophagaceae bacterium]
MVIDNLVLSPIPVNELLDLVRQVVREEICIANKSNAEEKMLSAKEACKLFVPAITRPTLDKLCQNGLLSKHYVGSRIFFRKAEVLDSLKSYKRYVQGGK